MAIADRISYQTDTDGLRRFTLSYMTNCATGNRLKRVFVGTKRGRCRSLSAPFLHRDSDPVPFLIFLKNTWTFSREFPILSLQYKTILQINMIANFSSDGYLTIIQSTANRQGIM